MVCTTYICVVRRQVASGPDFAARQNFENVFKILQNFAGSQNLAQMPPDVERRKYKLYTPLELTVHQLARTGTIPEF